MAAGVIQGAACLPTDLAGTRGLPSLLLPEPRLASRPGLSPVSGYQTPLLIPLHSHFLLMTPSFILKNTLSFFELQSQQNPQVSPLLLAVRQHQEGPVVPLEEPLPVLSKPLAHSLLSSGPHLPSWLCSPPWPPHFLPGKPFPPVSPLTLCHHLLTPRPLLSQPH